MSEKEAASAALTVHDAAVAAAGGKLSGAIDAARNRLNQRLAEIDRESRNAVNAAHWRYDETTCRARLTYAEDVRLAHHAYDQALEAVHQKVT